MVSWNGRKIGSVEGGDAKKTKGWRIFYTQRISQSLFGL